MTAPAEPTSRPPAALDLLRSARDRYGRSPEEWLTAALSDVDGPVLELRGAPSDRVTIRLIGSGTGVAEPDRLPVRTNGLAGVRATMCLPALGPLDGLFAELRRVLRPTGTVAALVPSRPGGPLTTPRAWRPLNRALAGHPGFRHQSARDHLSWLLTAADFAVLVDQRRTFWIPIPDPDGAARAVAALVPAGVWPPDVEPDRLRRAVDGLARHAAPGRRLPIPLRLLVGRR
jgi:SAM-dependent methyltransferase